MRLQPADEIPLIEILQPSVQAWNIVGRSGLRVTAPSVRTVLLCCKMYSDIQGCIRAPRMIRSNVPVARKTYGEEVIMKVEKESPRSVGFSYRLISLYVFNAQRQEHF